MAALKSGLLNELSKKLSRYIAALILYTKLYIQA